LTASAIYRADLDGGNIEDVLITAVGERVSLALDVSGGKMYWADRVGRSIQRGDLAGDDFEDLLKHERATIGMGSK